MILCLFFTACKKDKTTNSSSLVGRWVWTKSIEGIGSTTTSPQSTGKTWNLTFGADFSCSQSGDLKGTSSGTYNLTEDTIDSSKYYFMNVSFFYPADRFSYIFIDSDHIEISNGEMEGQNHFFVRAN